MSAPRIERQGALVYLIVGADRYQLTDDDLVRLIGDAERAWCGIGALGQIE